jgi:hypothetical protein
MYEFLKDLASDNDWVFEYSRTDYQNLMNELQMEKVHLFVDPITIDSSFSESGFETKSYSGKMMLLLSSDVDESYQDKYQDYIKPLLTTTLQTLKGSLVCTDATFNKFQSTEVINLFDENLDGLLINYNISF